MHFTPKKLYVVWGETGKHSDYKEWSVCAYTEKEMAGLHAGRCNEWLKTNGMHANGRDTSTPDIGPYANPYDLGAVYDRYYGSNYQVKELDLYLHLDQFLENTPTQGV